MISWFKSLLSHATCTAIWRESSQLDERTRLWVHTPPPYTCPNVNCQSAQIPGTAPVNAGAAFSCDSAEELRAHCRTPRHLLGTDYDFYLRGNGGGCTT